MLRWTAREGMGQSDDVDTSEASVASGDADAAPAADAPADVGQQQ